MLCFFYAHTSRDKDFLQNAMDELLFTQIIKLLCFSYHVRSISFFNKNFSILVNTIKKLCTSYIFK